MELEHSRPPADEDVERLVFRFKAQCRGGEMRIALVTISGDPHIAASVLESRFPGAEIVSYPRAALDNGSYVQRLSHLRKVRPAIVSVITESLDWQFGQEALMLFGALAGARRSIIFDAHGGAR